jgi:hypothetical protein
MLALYAITYPDTYVHVTTGFVSAVCARAHLNNKSAIFVRAGVRYFAHVDLGIITDICSYILCTFLFEPPLLPITNETAGMCR